MTRPSTVVSCSVPAVTNSTKWVTEAATAVTATTTTLVAMVIRLGTRHRLTSA